MAIALDPVMKASGGTWIAHGSVEADRDVVNSSDRVKVPPENPLYTLRKGLAHQGGGGRLLLWLLQRILMTFVPHRL
jgi:hypothetical protein